VPYPFYYWQSTQLTFVQNKTSGVTQPNWRFWRGSGEMAELFDMKKLWAIAFGDYNKSQDNAST
jgi:dihydroorotase